ncbi:MAG: hypothetical protein ACREPE_10970 [Lysobacter sp.]
MQIIASCAKPPRNEYGVYQSVESWHCVGVTHGIVVATAFYGTAAWSRRTFVAASVAAFVAAVGEERARRFPLHD